MFEQYRPRPARPNRASIDAICADYLDELHRALMGAHTIPRETRLQHERLSMRFARKIKIGERGSTAVGRRDAVGDLLDSCAKNASF